MRRSVDSALEPPRLSAGTAAVTSATTATGAAAAAASASTRSTDNQQQRWIVEEPVRQNTTRLSPAKDPDMATTRGPNVSVLHLRSTSDPWETSPTSVFTTSTATSRSYATTRTSQSCQPQLTKHQSLGGYNQSYKYNNQGFHSGGEINSAEIFLNTSCNRELSPVRWCDKEVDGVYLGRSGWVQVQQRSLDENRRNTYVSTESLQPSKRIGIKLADYHCKSEPGKYSDIRNLEPQRPIYLPLRAADFEVTKKSPSPHSVPENFSPPSVTPIISPPPAFQDKNTKSTKSRTFFGKPPFLPRSNAIVDDDVSPPTSPKKIITWNSAPTRKLKAPSPSTEQIRSYPRIPQTKSLEDATASRRTQFLQKYGESSSSSSSSMGFRSLDSYVPRVAMPRLSENTDSSVDVYEDADDEDNNSSSINISMVPPKEKTSPSGRGSRLPYRVPIRKSPASSDSNKQPSCASPTSSTSSSGNEFPTRSPSGTLQQMRRSAPARQYQIQEDPSLRVRRSRSLQLPERKAPTNFGRIGNQKVSPQHPESHRVIVKIGNESRSNKRMNKENDVNEELLREAEVVTSYLYGNRARAAQQALMIHRYNNIREEKSKPEQKAPGANIYNVYVVGNGKDRQKLLQRGSTAPALTSVKKEIKNPCNSDTCDFWPHCAHRETLNSQAQSMMRLSHSYPSHQRSMDKTSPENNRPTLERSKRLSRADTDVRSYSNLPTTRRPTSTGFSVDSGTAAREKRLSPNKSVERKTSPVSVASVRSPVPRNESSSSSSDVYVTTSDRTSTKSPKNAKSSGASTPMDEIAPPVIVKEEAVREIVLTRPGSAPGEENKTGGSFVDNQQRSMSLPKSFLSASYQPTE
ncbi:hypothetical protein Trydic_g1683 [Trypoxylus dichotomus]